MENLVIAETDSTPTVNFSINGKLSLKGRSLPENVKEFYTPLEEWVAKLDVKSVTFVISLDYINSASSKKILDVLKSLDENNNVEDIIVNWHYDEGDDDSLESGQIFEELLSRSEFKYILRV